MAISAQLQSFQHRQQAIHSIVQVANWFFSRISCSKSYFLNETNVSLQWTFANRNLGFPHQQALYYKINLRPTDSDPNVLDLILTSLIYAKSTLMNHINLLGTGDGNIYKLGSFFLIDIVHNTFISYKKKYSPINGHKFEIIMICKRCS